MYKNVLAAAEEMIRGCSQRRGQVTTTFGTMAYGLHLVQHVHSEKMKGKSGIAMILAVVMKKHLVKRRQTIINAKVAQLL